MIRLFDILFSSLAIAFLLPVLVPCALILKFTGEKEIFYFQERIGKNKRKFSLYKFTTMLKNSENIGSGTITIKDDPRVLPFGKFLRSTKINELPQLINILIGDMSIIGPRPLLEKQFSMYDINDQEIICSVRPGLSGVGSVIFRDEENMLSKASNPHEFYKKNITPYKAYLEKWFVEEKSLFLYFKLIVVTVIVVIFKTNNPEKLISDKILSSENYFKENWN